MPPAGQDDIEALATELGVEQLAQPYKGDAIYDVQSAVVRCVPRAVGWTRIPL